MNPLGPLSIVLDALRLPFVVVGSTASSARGIPRFTKDIDLIVRIGAIQAEGLASALGKEWYAEPDQIRQAIQNGRSFNVIHIPSSWKIDLFPAQTDFHDSEMHRATPEPLIIDGESVVCPVSTLWARRLRVTDLLEKALIESATQ